MSLLFCATSASLAFAQTDTNHIKDGIEIVICFPDNTIMRDTFTVEEWMQQLPSEPQERNKSLRQLNEQMKEPKKKPE